MLRRRRSMGAAQMAQPISTIAEAAYEAQAKLCEDSLQSTITTDASPTGPHGAEIKSIPTRREHGIDGDGINDPVLDAPHGGPQSTPVVLRLSPIAPPTAPGIPDVAGPPMAPTATPVEGDVAIEVMRNRSSLNPGLAEVPEVSPIAPPTAPGIPDVAGPGPVEGDVAIEDMRNRLLLNPGLAEVPELSPVAPPTALGIPDVAGPSPVEGDVAIEDMRNRLLLNPGLAEVPELSPIAPPTAPGIPDVAAPPMAPGIGGFNIDPPAPRASPIKGCVAVEDMRGRWLFKPEMVRQLPIQTAQDAMIVRTGKSSFVFHLLAIVAVVGVMLLAFPDEAGKEVSDSSRAVMPLHEDLSSAGTSAYPARLVIESQKGFANEPLPLGISLKDASGGETVTVAGLAEGTELSLGTSLGLAGWLVSAGDLDKTFVGVPQDFVGVMDATVNLRSASDQLLDSQVVRLEWIEKKEERLTLRLDPPKQAQVFQPLNADDIATLIEVGEDLLKRGDITSARVSLKRAALAGNAQAALELGMTFDQAFLAKWGVLGFAADAAQAREWYDKAIKLGSTEAARHLARLASMPR
jgi:hypothetical protein